MSAIVPFEECVICKKPNVISINSGWIHQSPYQLICKQNKLTYNKETVRLLNLHFRDHLVTPKQAMVNTMLQEEAVKLKNTVIETNIALDQIDDLKRRAFHRLTNLSKEEDTPKNFALLQKSYTDLLDKQVKLLAFHNKISGKEAQEELYAAALGGMINEVSKALGAEKVKQIRTNARQSKSVMSYFEDDEHLSSLFQELEDTAKENEVIDVDQTD